MDTNSIPRHVLKQPTRCVIPEFLIFVDVETHKSETIGIKDYHELTLGTAIFNRIRADRETEQKEYKRFTTREDFWSWSFSKVLKKKVLYMISHNANFDFTVLKHIRYLSDANYTNVFACSENNLFISKWRNGQSTIVILNNGNWFHGTLAKWGDELNLPKLNMSEHLHSKESLFTYCERDTEILYQLQHWYIEFLKDNNLGSWKFTIASQSMEAYKHRFMNHPITIPGTCEENILARQSYHGGRCECFWTGTFTNGPYYKIDVNSMYPYVMKQHQYPTNYEGTVENPDIGKVEATLEHYCIIADTTISPTEPYFCYNKDDRNVYPIGTFRTTLTTEELKLAFKHKWVVNIHQCNVYRKRDIFTSFVNFFYAMKQRAGKEDKPLFRSLSKLILNSQYGKWGQKGHTTQVLTDEAPYGLKSTAVYNRSTGERYHIQQIGKTILYNDTKGESYNSFAAIASHITANARLYLYSLILQANRKHCYYCDTDSLIIDSMGMENIALFLNDSKLGWLKLEDISPEIAINAAKDYEFNGHRTRKGIRKNAEQIDVNTYKMEIWPGFKTILQSGQEEYYTTWMIKQLDPVIFSGLVDSNGTIQPFVIS